MENFDKMSILGHDSDDALSTFIFVIIAVMIVVMIIAVGGAFIGGFHVLKNYIVAFRHNVIDSNRRVGSAA